MVRYIVNETVICELDDICSLSISLRYCLCRCWLYTGHTVKVSVTPVVLISDNKEEREGRGGKGAGGKRRIRSALEARGERGGSCQCAVHSL